MIELSIGDFIQPKDTGKKHHVALVSGISDGNVELMWFRIKESILHRIMPKMHHKYEMVASRSVFLGSMVGKQEALIWGEAMSVPGISWKHIANYDDTHVI